METLLDNKEEDTQKRYSVEFIKKIRNLDKLMEKGKEEKAMKIIQSNPLDLPDMKDYYISSIERLELQKTNFPEISDKINKKIEIQKNQVMLINYIMPKHYL